MTFAPRSPAAFPIAFLCAAGAAVAVQRRTGPADAHGTAPGARFRFVAPIVPMILVGLTFGTIQLGHVPPFEAIALPICILAVLGGFAFGRGKPLP